jgi:hypothetical protein
MKKSSLTDVQETQSNSYNILSLELNSVVWVRERTLPTERPPLVGEVSANFEDRNGLEWSERRIPRP